MYISDSSNDRVQKFDSSGVFISKWGTSGSGDGEFSYPWGITVGPDGRIYVADWRNDRVQRFTHEGEFVELVQGMREGVDGALVNAAGFTHTSVAILDALLATDGPDEYV